jgi:predicted nucleotidyltransferase
MKGLQKVKDYVKYSIDTTPGIKKVNLFGSHARGTQSENSDIDIAFVFDSISDTFDLQVELMKKRRYFDTRIEPHPISSVDFNKSNPLATEIMKHGFEIV